MADEPKLIIQAPQPRKRAPGGRKYAECKCEGKAPHLHELAADGKLKVDGVVIYADISPDDNHLVYSETGLTCKRTFKIDGVTITGSGAGTLWDASYGDSAIPWRGDLHPYITATMLGLPANVVFAVDVVTVTPLSSTQIQVVCDYAYLSAKNQEPSSDNNKTTALLSIASSVQNQQTSVNSVGQPLLNTYTGAFNIIDDSGNIVYGAPGNTKTPAGTAAVSCATANKQVPNPVFTFVRRETATGVYASVPSPNLSIVGLVNNQDWIIAGISYPLGSILCIRDDAEPIDNGRSVLTTRQFQYSPPTAAQAPSGTPGDTDYIPPVPAMKGWQIGTFFTVQNGTANVIQAAPQAGRSVSSAVAQAGQIPPDDSATVYDISDPCNFSLLFLTGTTPPGPISR